jgi:hypothetical protein
MASSLGLDVMYHIAMMAEPDDLVRMGAVSKWMHESLRGDVHDVKKERSALIKYALRASYGVEDPRDAKARFEAFSVSQLRAFRMSVM